MTWRKVRAPYFSHIHFKNLQIMQHNLEHYTYFGGLVYSKDPNRFGYQKLESWNYIVSICCIEANKKYVNMYEQNYLYNCILCPLVWQVISHKYWTILFLTKPKKIFGPLTMIGHKCFFSTKPLLWCLKGHKAIFSLPQNKSASSFGSLVHYILK